MKKIVVATVFVLLATVSFTQKSSKSVRIGFMLEPNIAWFHPVENGVQSDGAKVGINYGLMLDYEFAENYIFSTGLKVEHIGGKLSYTGNIWPDKHIGYIAADNSDVKNTANYNIGIQYIQIPFAIKLKTNNRGRMDYWGSFGGFIGVPVKARADVQTNFTSGGISNFSKDNDNVLSAVQPISVGMQIGAGVEIPFADKNVFIVGLTFNNGFIDVTRNSKFGDDGRINLNNIALKLGVFF
jgi:Outer membrane protein beta-barrel domain